MNTHDGIALLVGTASADITPPIGAYDGRHGRHVEVIEDAVTARALYLEQPGGEAPVVLAMADFGGVTYETDRRLRRLIGDAVGTPPERVRINTTHNHTCIGGYRTVHALYQSVGHEFFDIEWFEQCVEMGFVAAAMEAKATRRNATVAIGTAPVHGVMSSRLFLDESGAVTARMGVTDDRGRRAPRGLFDPDLYALCFRDRACGAPICTVINLACHATSISARGALISPDFPGYAASLVEQETGGPTFFLQGAGGNVGPGKDADGTVEGARVLGRRVADAALLAMRRAILCPPAPLHFHTWTQQVELLPDLPDEAQARRAFDQCAAGEHHPSELWRHAALLEVVSQREVVSRCELFIVHHGDWCLAGLPGETFVESQLAIRGASALPFALVGGYYDTTLWYIPTHKAIREGGYESRGGWTYTAAGASECLTRSTINRIATLM